jgi:hypothetical protein
LIYFSLLAMAFVMDGQAYFHNTNSTVRKTISIQKIRPDSGVKSSIIYLLNQNIEDVLFRRLLQCFKEVSTKSPLRTMPLTHFPYVGIAD